MDIVASIIKALFGSKADKDRKQIEPYLEKIKAVYPSIEKLTNDELRAHSEALKKQIADFIAADEARIVELKAILEKPETQLEEKEKISKEIDETTKRIDEKIEEVLDKILPEAFAIMKDTARRFAQNETVVVTANDFDRNLAATKDFVTIEGDKAVYATHWLAGGNDTKWDMIHYDVQLFGGVVLHQGKIAEMATGEGKTLVATLPVFLNALAKKGVHMVTVNNYLAKRDSEWMGPMYQFHGLSVACIDDTQPNSDARREAYMADITFGTNNEYGFDYLRDNMASSPKDLVQRKHHFAIVDEVDSVLIDDARTPLIISGPVPKGDDQMFEQYRPAIESLYNLQKNLVTALLAEARQLISEGKNDEGGVKLYRAHKGLPKYKPLIKYLSEQGVKALMQKTENTYMQDNNRRMPEITDDLYFVIDEKLNSVELTDKGHEALSKYFNEDGFFVMPDIGAEVAELEKSSLTPEEKAIVYDGPMVKKHIFYHPKGSNDAAELDFTYFSAVKTVENALAKVKDESGMKRVERFLRLDVCPDCRGSRFSEAARASKIMGVSIDEVSRMPLVDLCAWVDRVPASLPPEMRAMAECLCEAFRHTAARLLDLGLGYLSLDRAASTLSTGERQRMQLARAVRNRTTGVLYVLDEPSIGLHPANVEGLKAVMHDLVADGNTVLLVDHDVDILREADRIIEMGPKAGREGGRVIAEGSVGEIEANSDSMIGPYLSGRPAVVRTKTPRDSLFEHGEILLETKAVHTVKPLSVRIPKGRLTVVTGVSGSGKTTLVLESLLPALRAAIDGTALPAHVGSISAQGIRQAKLIDATPIGVNVRSTVATYANVHDDLRKAFAKTPDAKAAGMKAGDFSYNTGRLRCPECDGTGSISLDVQFLPDVDVPCPACRGSRYAPAAFAIRRAAKAAGAHGTQSAYTLPEFMDMDVSTALRAAADMKTVSARLRVLEDLGLGYLTLGEATPGLSGGEAQRLKLAGEMGRGQDDVLFVFDEPTIGLHPENVATLMAVFERLVEAGATVIVIEHDLDVIRAADWMIDLGPGGGDAGGTVVFEGVPEDAPAEPRSVTGRHLGRRV